MREIALTLVRPFVFVASDTSIDLQLEFVLGERGVVVEVLGWQTGVSFTLAPFLNRPLRADELDEYVGAYRCHELQTTVLVDVVGSRLRLRNKQRHFCSMDLVYDPTIRDSFVAYDPHPAVSLITFLRENGRVLAFVYRDPDGDRREDLLFLQLNL
jgi:hypothetical protein